MGCLFFRVMYHSLFQWLKVLDRQRFYKYLFFISQLRLLFVFKVRCLAQWLLDMVKQIRNKAVRKSEQLSALIKKFWLESGAIYSERKIYCDLIEMGEYCGINPIQWLMNAKNLRS